ncbi:hypothetical protein [Sporosarcina psychrophila]|uniref:hypothetical protein n=1 Tax=Sporosarcina psychrophila TaxID=1476 RepID=UPI00078C4EBA|nr:hypothetical protein [Sporosarcina psychrophila]AMQ07671.1 hypothetical protein AZE41_17970 [Sporosarcina psychrophila]
MFSEATELILSEIGFNSSNIDFNKLSITPFVEKNILTKDIELLLTNLESKIELSIEDITPLASLISLYYYDDNKEEYEFRLKSLIDLQKVGEFISVLEMKEAINPVEIDQLLSTISLCGHGPHRSLLEHKLNCYKNELPKNEIVEQDFLRILATTNKHDLVDNALCELSAEEYINLGKEKRLVVSKELLGMNRENASFEEITNMINEIINSADFSYINTDTANNVDIKDTVFANELPFVQLIDRR